MCCCQRLRTVFSRILVLHGNHCVFVHCMHYWFDCCLITALTMMIQNDAFVLIIPAFESPVFDAKSIG